VSVRTATGSVRELLDGHCHFELGSPELAEGPRVALLAHFSTRTLVTRSVATFVDELQQHGYRVVVASSCEATGALVWPDRLDTSQLSVIRKPNIGYDFGTWSIALQLVPAALSAERTIVANDSMAGPFVTLRPILESLDRTPADVWGLTDTQQFGSHLQSYFLAFCNGVLAERPLQRFWSEIRHETDKTEIIMRNELGLSRLLHAEGYVRVPEFSHERVVLPGLNPVIKGWRRLLDLGFPFVKREILRDPDVAPHGERAPHELQRRFGVDVTEWVDEVVWR
jgi:lipopolysaccharide biosynthesis protein